MKVKQTRILVFLFAYLIFGSIFISVITFGLEQTDDKELATLNLSESSTVDYMEYVHLVAENVGPQGSISWQFTGSNSFVGIIVFIMDQQNWEIFLVDYTLASGYTVSDGSYYIDSGTWTPAKQSTWYVAFLNIDSDQESTVLTYSMTCTGCFPLGLLIGIIIAIIVPAAVIVVVVFLVLRKKKKRRELSIAPEKEPEIPVTKKEPIKYTKVVEGVKKVFDVSDNRIDLEMLRDAVPMDKHEFNSKILDLAKEYGFKIELEILHVSDEKRDDFIDALINALQE